MIDRLTLIQRRSVMARNRGKDTGPEVVLRKQLWKRGLRYRKHYPLTGRPDISFPSAKLVVFIDGCFWHGCPTHYVSPQTRSDFWKAKLEKNRTRDAVVNERLRKEGWTVLRFWEHEVDKNLLSCVAKIAEALGRPLPEPLGATPAAPASD